MLIQLWGLGRRAPVSIGHGEKEYIVCCLLCWSTGNGSSKYVVLKKF